MLFSPSCWQGAEKTRYDCHSEEPKATKNLSSLLTSTKGFFPARPESSIASLRMTPSKHFFSSLLATRCAFIPSWARRSLAKAGFKSPISNFQPALVGATRWATRLPAPVGPGSPPPKPRQGGFQISNLKFPIRSCRGDPLGHPPTRLPAPVGPGSPPPKPRQGGFQISNFKFPIRSCRGHPLGHPPARLPAPVGPGSPPPKLRRLCGVRAARRYAELVEASPF